MFRDDRTHDGGLRAEQVIGRRIAEVVPYVMSAERTEALRQCIALRELRTV